MTQLRKGYTPYLWAYLVAMHCVAHWTSLAAGSLSYLPIMANLEEFVE